MLNKVALFCIFLFIAYANSLHNPFMLDDFNFLDQFQRSTFKDLIGPEQGRSYYRPMANIVPWVEWKIFGKDVSSLHAMNIVLLACAGLTVYAFLAKIFDPAAGWAAALVFCVHPINGLMVNYITASVFAVEVTCMGLALYFIVIPAKAGIQRSGFLLLTCVFFILALFCHETAILLPLYAVLLLSIQEGPCWKGIFARTLPLFITGAVYIIFRRVCVPLDNSLLHSLSVVHPTLLQMAVTVMDLSGWYISKLLAPVNIYLMWAKPFAQIGAGIFVWIFAAFFLAAVAVSIAFKNVRGLRQMLAWFFAGFFPLALAAFATPYMGALIEPHWFVFASVGFFTALVLLLRHFWGAKPFVFGTIIAVLTAVLLVFTWRNNLLWASEKLYYQTWLKEDPEFVGIHYFLGTVYLRENNLEEARKHFQKSILGRKKDWMVYLDMADIDVREKHYDQARQNLQKALAPDPNNVAVMNAVGAFYFAQNEFDKAGSWFRHANFVAPRDIGTLMNMALVHLKKSENGKAAALYQEILKINPGFFPARQALMSTANKN